MGKFFTLFFLALLINPILGFSQCGTTDHAGANWIITSPVTVGGTHTNVGKFEVLIGVTVTVDAACKFLIVEADTIIIYGTINGDGKGDIGGSGGNGGLYANGSGVPGSAGLAGLAGYGVGGGTAGVTGGVGGYIVQICGGLFCSGNQDGFNGGGGGAGGGGGGSYGGLGGGGGYGAFGSGFTGADGGMYGAAGTAAPAYGTATGYDISWGSGGAGGGGGGGGWSSGTNGGIGGIGGGMVTMKAAHKLIMSGNISCNGTDGGNGGAGGGESDDNGFDCSTSGYNACGLCSESIFDAAGGAGGAAGAGSGGGIYIESNGTATITGTLNVLGGAGGTAGNPSSTIGTCYDNARGGGGGSGGRVKILLNPCINNLISPVSNVAGGAGGSGVSVGFPGADGSLEYDLIAQSYIALNGGTISEIDTIFCNFGDVPIIASVSAGAGGMGTFNYQWEYSTTDSISGFANYPGQTNITMDPSLISVTTWFRRKVSSGSCIEYSNAVKASVVDCSGFEDNTALPFTIYPVPNNGSFTIETSFGFSEVCDIYIYNARGELVKRSTIPAGQSKLDIQLNAQPGLYLIVLYSGQDIGLKKIAIE